MLKEIKKPVQYVIVNEAGASVYSASKFYDKESQQIVDGFGTHLYDENDNLIDIDKYVVTYQDDFDCIDVGRKTINVFLSEYYNYPFRVTYLIICTLY